MAIGIVDVITLLLGLSGFGVQQDPKAPTPDVALQYAMPDSDVVVHFDAAMVVPNNYKVLTGLPNSPAIKASPDIANAVRKAIGEIEGVRGLAKAATGIDVVTDVNDATMFVKIVPKQDPSFVAVVHGKFAPTNLDKIAGMTKKQVAKVGGGVIIDMGATEPAVGVTKDGVLIAGDLRLVKDRVGDAWKAPPRAPGSTLAHAADVIAEKPIYAVVVTLSQAARKAANDNMREKNFVTDMINRHKLATFSVFHDGIGWTWIDSSKAGLDNMETMSSGTLELLKTAHIAPRAFAKIALGALDSYKGTNKQVDDLIRRKGDVMKLVETYTGDGNFRTSIVKDPKTLKLTVRATGKSLSEVVPVGALLPLGAIGFLTVRNDTAGSQIAAPPPAPAKPAPKATPGLAAPKK